MTASRGLKGSLLLHNTGHRRQKERPSTGREQTLASRTSNQDLTPSTGRELTQHRSKTPNCRRKHGHRTRADTFPKDTDGRQTCEKMLDVTHRQGNANQSHSDISPDTCQNSWIRDISSVAEDAEKRNPTHTVVGLRMRAAPLGNTLEIPHQTKHRTTLRPSNSTSGSSEKTHGAPCRRNIIPNGPDTAAARLHRQMNTQGTRGRWTGCNIRHKNQ